MRRRRGKGVKRCTAMPATRGSVAWPCADSLVFCSAWQWGGGGGPGGEVEDPDAASLPGGALGHRARLQRSDRHTRRAHSVDVIRPRWATAVLVGVPTAALFWRTHQVPTPIGSVHACRPPLNYAAAR